MNRSYEGKARAQAGGLDERALSSLFQQMRSAEARMDALRAQASGPVQENVVLAAFQELDSAHEELRVAEEHLHSQADTIAQTRDALDVERGRYRELFDVAPDPYLLTDVHGNILEANQRACALLNIEAAFLSGKPLAAFVGAEDRSQFRTVLDLLLREQAVSSFELRLQPRSSVTPAWVAVSASRALGPDGAPTALRWLLRDVTLARDGLRHHREQTTVLEQKLRERTQELDAAKHLLEHSLAREQMARAQATAAAEKHETLLAAIAHELRSPLSSVSGWLQAIRGGQVEAETKERAVASMTRSVRVLTRMVEDLVDHARCGEDFFHLERSTVQLPALLAQALEDCRPTAAQKGVCLDADFPGGVPDIEADPQRLLQVLSNLLGNSVKFTPRGGEVKLSLKCLARHVEIVIADTGAGIDPAFLPHVFDAFAQHSQGRVVSRPAGLGLGLHLSRWLVELHGGSIRAESPGRGLGARFVVRLPSEKSAVVSIPSRPSRA
jgi:PAS domain S-box-containing protein